MYTIGNYELLVSRYCCATTYMSRSLETNLSDRLPLSLASSSEILCRQTLCSSNTPTTHSSPVISLVVDARDNGAREMKESEG